MIKCERNGKTTSVEALGDVITLAADCCEIISAIFASAPPLARSAFKACVLLAVNHKDSPMWSVKRKAEGISTYIDIEELKRQCGMSDEGGGQQRDES